MLALIYELPFKYFQSVYSRKLKALNSALITIEIENKCYKVYFDSLSKCKHAEELPSAAIIFLKCYTEMRFVVIIASSGVIDSVEVAIAAKVCARREMRGGVNALNVLNEALSKAWFLLFLSVY